MAGEAYFYFSGYSIQHTAGTFWFDLLNKLPMFLEFVREFSTGYKSYKKIKSCQGESDLIDD